MVIWKKHVAIKWYVPYALSISIFTFDHGPWPILKVAVMHILTANIV